VALSIAGQIHKQVRDLAPVTSVKIDGSNAVVLSTL
jgi:hypothetical protein